MSKISVLRRSPARFRALSGGPFRCRGGFTLQRTLRPAFLGGAVERAVALVGGSCFWLWSSNLTRYTRLYRPRN
jgi:hypothetical protein